MKKKMYKTLGVALTVMLLASLTVGLAATPAAAGDGAWTKFPYPRPGALSGYTLVPVDTSDASKWAAGPALLERAIDGTLYAYWDVGETDDLYKSTDEGRSWSRCSSSTDDLPSATLVDITLSLEDSDTLYVATTTEVYRSTNAGSTFTKLGAISLASNEVISCLSVGFAGGTHWIVVGTDNTTTTTTYNGEVYIKEDTFAGAWNAQNVNAGFTGTYDVRDVAVSPNFATEADAQIVAVITNATTTYVAYQYGSAAWKSATASAELLEGETADPHW